MIFFAGNSSQKNKPLYLDKEMLDDGTYVKAGKYQLFEDTQGKGMLFAGSLTYTPVNGEEQYSYFSQHPPRNTLHHHVLAPSENLLIKHTQNSYEIGIGIGTSLSAPIVVSSFAILKDYATAKGLSKA